MREKRKHRVILSLLKNFNRAPCAKKLVKQYFKNVYYGVFSLIFFLHILFLKYIFLTKSNQNRCSLGSYAHQSLTQIKRKKNFLTYKEIKKRSDAKSYMTDGLLIYS
jgi:hypothetical protein